MGDNQGVCTWRGVDLPILLPVAVGAAHALHARLVGQEAFAPDAGCVPVLARLEQLQRSKETVKLLLPAAAMLYCFVFIRGKQ